MKKWKMVLVFFIIVAASCLTANQKQNRSQSQSEWGEYPDCRLPTGSCPLDD